MFGGRIEFRGGASACLLADERIVCLDSGAGTGKSISALAKALHVFTTYQGSRQLFLRLTRISLAETVLVDWEAMLPLDLLRFQGSATRAHRESYRHQNGSIVVCGGADQVDRYLSGKYDRIYIAQAEEIRDMEVIYKLATRLRSGRTPYHQIVLDVNPAEASHPINVQCDQVWCNHCRREPLLEEGAFCAKCERKVERRIRRIAFRIEDNPRWWDWDRKAFTREGEEYMAWLETTDGVTRERLLYHRWVTAEGLVWPTYDAAHHLIGGKLERDSEGWSLELQDEAHPLHVATGGLVRLGWFFADMDVGHTAPGCFQVWGVDKDGIAIRVAEYYHAAWDDDDWAERACELWEEFRFRAGIVDSAHRGTIALLNKRVSRLSGMPQIFIGATKGPGSVEAGIRHVRTLWKRSERTGLASVYLWQGASRVVDPNLARRHRPVSFEGELPSYVLARPTPQTPEQEIPDPAMAGHACAAARYGLTWAFPLNLTPAPRRPELPPDSYGAVLFRNRGGMLGLLNPRRKYRRSS